jgi:hypothetical protein
MAGLDVLSGRVELAPLDAASMGLVHHPPRLRADETRPLRNRRCKTSAAHS